MLIGQKNIIITLCYKNKPNINMFYTKIKRSYKKAPHNKNVIYVVIGYLLGNSYINRRHIYGVVIIFCTKWTRCTIFLSITRFYSRVQI